MLLAFIVTLGGGSLAFAQAPIERRVFADADYEAYFTEGFFSTESPTHQSRGFHHHTLKGGKLTVSYIEVMPRWDRLSPYPFVKLKDTDRVRLGVLNKKLNARVYQISNTEFDVPFGEVWLSRDKRMTISAADVSVGSMRDHNKATSIAAGKSPERADAAYRRSVVGDWSLRCAFVKGPTYEVECINVHLESGYRIVRRYLKQTGMS